MNPPTFQEYLADPSAVTERVMRAARRQRAAALHSLLKELFR